MPPTIDFSDPGQTTHQGEVIPINTQAKYDAGKAVLQRLYVFYGVLWTSASEEAYEKRVRNGQTFKEIVLNTYDEFLDRTAEPAPH